MNSNWEKIKNRACQPMVLLALFALLFLGDLLIGGGAFLLRDQEFGGYGAWQFPGVSLAGHGEIPLWNPNEAGGKTFAGDLASTLFYWPAVVFWIFPLYVAENLYILMHLWIAGAGAWFLARQILSPPADAGDHFRMVTAPALVAGLSFMLGTWLVSRVDVQWDFSTSVWWPWLFGIIIKFTLQLPAGGIRVCGELWRQRRLAAAFTLVCATQFMANYPQMMLYPYAAYGVFVIGAGVWRRSFKTALTVTLFVGAAGLLAVLLVLPQMGPQMEFIPLSERGMQDFDARFNMASLQWAHLLTAVFPYLAGGVGYPDAYWGRGVYEFWLGAFYPGALALLVAPFALWFLFNKETKHGFTTLMVAVALTVTLAGWLLSMGENTPLYPWVHHHVPLMNRFRFPSKFLVLVTIGGTLLAAPGLRAVAELRGRREKFTTAVLAIEGALVLAAGVVALVAWLHPQTVAGWFNGGGNVTISAARLAQLGTGALAAFAFLAAAYGLLWILLKKEKHAGRWAVLAVAFAFVNLWAISRPMYPTGSVATLQKAPEIVRIAADRQYRALPVYYNAMQYFYGAPEADFQWGREAGAGHWGRWGVNEWAQGHKLMKFRALNDGLLWSGTPATSERLMDILGIRWAITGQPWQQVLWAGADRRLQLVERPGAVPRVFLATKWHAVTGDHAVLEALARAQVEAREPWVEHAALLHRRAAEAAVPAPPANAAAGEVTIVRDANNTLVIKTRSAQPSLLMNSDTWYPGWRATVDGVEAPIHRANYMFRGVFVPAGEHTVRFDYWPTRFGWYLAAAALGLCVTGALFIRRRRQ
jgi:hypothetical protein